MITDRGLGDEGRQDCFLCSTEKGGSSGGLSGRIAIGRMTTSGTRFELVFMRAGGDGNDNDFTNGEDAYLQTVMLQFSAEAN